MTSRVVNGAPGSSSFASPSSRSMRTIILCFDGTSNEYSSENTNVVKLCSLFKRDNDKQVVYYQAGIGTYVAPSIVSTPYTWLAKVLDLAFAIYLSTHVMEGYKFLMQNYNVGDRVCLFGFSRGAYTARALAGMLNKVGLLGKDNDEQVSFAYKMYTSTDTRDDGTAAGFKQTFCREVPIDFLGVWETVASVGVVMGRTLPFVTNNHAIKTFRQALALDEHRAKFRPNFYIRFTPKVKTPRSVWHKLADLVRCRTTQPVEISSDSTEPHVSMNDVKKSEASSSDSGPSFETDVKEVWFVGCHSDVGGGNWPNETAQALQSIPLRWMVREVMKAECGVVWEEAAFARLGIPLGVPGSEGVQASDAADANQPITDPLSKTPLWWLLEVIPTEYSYVDEKTKQWVHKWSINLGRGRYIPKDGALFHSSVKERMDNGSLKYKPRARYENIQIAYVD